MSTWFPFVILAVLSVGTYIPTLHRGQVALGGSGVHAFLLVGVAYVLVAIAIPSVMITRAGTWDTFTAGGVGFAMAAGVLGALGALGIVLAPRERRQTDRRAADRLCGCSGGQRLRGHALQPAPTQPVAHLLPWYSHGRGRCRLGIGLSAKLTFSRGSQWRHDHPVISRAVSNLIRRRFSYGARTKPPST